jgi:hypothetical protein
MRYWDDGIGDLAYVKFFDPDRCGVYNLHAIRLVYRNLKKYYGADKIRIDSVGITLYKSNIDVHKKYTMETLIENEKEYTRLSKIHNKIHNKIHMRKMRLRARSLNTYHKNKMFFKKYNFVNEKNRLHTFSVKNLKYFL